MSMSGSVTMDWGDGQRKFRLAIGELEELEEVIGAGTGAIYKRVMCGDWHVRDVREIIRLGLIGGGMKPDRALKMVRRYVETCPWTASSLIALAVLDAALNGPPVEDEAEMPEEEEEPENPIGAKGRKMACPSPDSTQMAS